MPTSPLRSRALAPLALALFTALAGCGDPIAPEDVVGTYVLTRVDGREIPAVVALPTRYQVVYDTIDLRADGTARRTYRALLAQPTPGMPAELAGTDGLVHEFDGRQVTLRWPCPAGPLSCWSPQPIALRALGASVLWTEELSGVWEYRRVR